MNLDTDFVRQQFPAFAEDKILAFLKMMVGKKLMFQERDRYLSLAIPVKPSVIKQ